MPINELFPGAAAGPGLILAGFAGLLLGGFFFGSLWWTVRRTLSSPTSALWHLASLLLRMAVTLLGFYAVGAGHFENLLACLLGFVVARFVVTWKTRSWELRQTRSAPRKTPEAGHAPQP